MIPRTSPLFRMLFVTLAASLAGCSVRNLPRATGVERNTEIGKGYWDQMREYAGKQSKPGEVEFVMSSPQEMYGDASDKWMSQTKEVKTSQVQTIFQGFIRARIRAGIPADDAQKSSKVEIHAPNGDLAARADGNELQVTEAK